MNARNHVELKEHKQVKMPGLFTIQCERVINFSNPVTSYFTCVKELIDVKLVSALA